MNTFLQKTLFLKKRAFLPPNGYFFLLLLSQQIKVNANKNNANNSDVNYIFDITNLVFFLLRSNAMF